MGVNCSKLMYTYRTDMSGDQHRPSNRPHSDHEQVVEDNERSIAEAYRCLY